MTAKELHDILHSGRSGYVPGVPMDAETDQKVLLGFLDGIFGGKADSEDTAAYAMGIKAGRALRKVLK